MVTEPHSGRHAFIKAVTLGSRVTVVDVILFFLAATAFIAWLVTWSPGLSACEDAIKASLARPSSYERVKIDGTSTNYRITYDAENSSGVRSRRSGLCFVSDGRATWLDQAAR